MSDGELEALLDQSGYRQLLESPRAESPPPDAILERTPPRRKKPRVDELLSKPQAKAKREKERREKMNRRFASLAELSNPEEPKTDKASILLDALVALKTIKAENDQLKQLNKFLEEKVGSYEKERSYVMYHQGLMLRPEPFIQGTAFGGVPRNTVLGTPVAKEGEESLDAFLHPPAA